METLENLPINALDLGVAVILLVSGLLACVRGLIHEVLSVGAWVGAIFATVFLYPTVQPHARDLVSIDLAADIGTGIVIFVLTLVVLSLATRTVSSRVKDSALNVLDRFLGFLFGLARGVIIICIAYLGLEFLVPHDEQPGWVTSARSIPLIRVGAAQIYALVPADVNIDIPTVEMPDATQGIIQPVVPDPPQNGDDSDQEGDLIENPPESGQ